VKKLYLTAILLTISIVVVFAQRQGLETGNTAPDIKLPDLKGELVALSSFRGKVVLVDFWATWCAPCLKEQPELSELYKHYKSAVFTSGKGFEIYGVSLDNDKTSWESGIKRMNIAWTQVSDLKFWASPVAKTYNIQALPFNVLIDGKGIIIAKNLHGAELNKELDKLLIRK
jgi:thiol-disulfide isomerase/thioredoxin